MAFLRLLPIARYEYYGDDGCFFSLYKKNVYINNKYAKKINDLVHGKLEYLENEYDDEFNDIVKELFNEGFIYSYDNPVYSEKLLFHNEKSVPGIIENPPRIKKLFVEADRKCGLKCEVCKLRELTKPCETCAIWKKEEVVCNYEKLINGILRIIKMPVEEVIISGGNPFLEWEYVEKAILAVRKKNRHIKISLVVNFLNLNIEKMDFLISNRVHLVVTVANINNVDQLKEKILYLQKIGIKHKVLLIEKTNLISYSSELLKENEIKLDNIVEKLDFEDIPLTLDKFHVRKNYTSDEILLQKNNNRCMSGNVAISLDGDVKVCPAWNEAILNLNDQKIDKVFCDENISRYWSKIRDISGCEKCALKWMCNDCMALLEFFKENNKNGKYICGKQ